MGLPYNDLLGHFSFTLTAMSFFMRDILFLRILAIASLLVGMIYNFRVPGGPLWLVIFWLFVLLSINIFRIIIHVYENRSISFSEEERDLFRTLFHRFPPVEFLKFIRLGEWRNAEPGAVLATQGMEIDDLKLIYNGEVSILRDRKEISRCSDGTLVGEMSYIHGGDATATVQVLRPTRYISWPRGELKNLLKRNPTMDLCMQGIFNEDLVRKLMEQSAEKR